MKTFRLGQSVECGDKRFQVVEIDRISKCHKIIFVNTENNRLYVKELETDENGNEYAEYNRKLNIQFRA